MGETERKTYGETARVIETLWPQRDIWMQSVLLAARKGARGEELSAIEESLVDTFERSMAAAFDVAGKAEG